VLDFFKIVILTLFLFLFLDFAAGNKLVKILSNKGIYITSEDIHNRNVENEIKFRVKNDFFSHTLRNNYNGISYFGSKKNKICTDMHGFKNSCSDYNQITNFDYWFIGDSVTEGVGLEYDDTFVGIFDKKTTFNVANLGVSSYSPIIYFHKIKFFLEKGLNTNHVILFLDVADIDDELIRIECNNKVCEKSQNSNKKKVYESKILGDYFKDLFKENLKFSTFFLSHIKFLVCRNLILDRCDYVYNKNNLRANWINNFEENISENGIFYKSFSQSIDYLNKIHEILASRDISFSLAIYPHPGNILYGKKSLQYREFFSNYCVSRCLFFFDLYDDFEDIEKKSSKSHVVKEYYFYNDQHFNKKGNKIIASKLLKKINK